MNNHEEVMIGNEATKVFWRNFIAAANLMLKECPSIILDDEKDLSVDEFHGYMADFANKWINNPDVPHKVYKKLRKLFDEILYAYGKASN